MRVTSVIGGQDNQRRCAVHHFFPSATANRHFATNSSGRGVASQIWIGLRVLGPDAENTPISRFPSGEKETASTSPWRLNAISWLPDFRLQSITSLSPP